MPIKKFGNTYREPIPHTRREDPYGTSKKINNPKGLLNPDPKDLLETGIIFYLLYKALGLGANLLKTIWTTISETAQKSVELGAQLLGFKNSTDMINYLKGKAEFKILVEKDYLVVTVNDAQISKILLPPEEKTVLKALDIPENTTGYRGTQYSFKDVDKSTTATIIYDILVALNYYSTYWTSAYSDPRNIGYPKQAPFECSIKIICSQESDALSYFCLIYYWELAKSVFAKTGRKNNIKLYSENCFKWNYFDLDQESAWLLF